MTRPSNNNQSNTDNPYAKNDGDYPEEVRIQRERDRLAADSNVQKMQIANSNAKAGSEEEIHTRLVEIGQSYGAYMEASKNKEMWNGMFRQIETYITTLIAQASAQAEMRGRISELESLSSFLQAGIQRSLKENGLSVYPEDTYPYKEEIEERLDQLRAQGGEK